MTIEKRPFGKTGHDSSAVIFGAAALKNVDQKTADHTLELLFRYGVNHIDTAPRYGDAELRIGSWMDHHRDDFFLATKIDKWDYAGAKTSLNQSLDRLRTDHIDLIQLHAFIYPDDCEQAFSDEGAIHALIEARKNGLVNHIGITGHGWTVAAMHRRNLERFPFDSVLLPWNWFAANHPYYRSDFDETLKYCRKHNIAVQTIKAIARGPWAAGATEEQNTWYQPLTEEVPIKDAVNWVLGEPDIFLNSVGDVNILPMVLEAADNINTKPSDQVMRELAEDQGLVSIFGI